jgi:hypothetical protein
VPQALVPLVVQLADPGREPPQPRRSPQCRSACIPQIANQNAAGRRDRRKPPEHDLHAVRITRRSGRFGDRQLGLRRLRLARRLIVGLLLIGTIGLGR